MRQFLRNRKAARARRQAEAEASDQFRNVRAEADRIGGMVCGVIRPDGRPVYYVAKKDTPEPELEARAFELAHDRPITYGEHLLREVAQRRRTASTK